MDPKTGEVYSQSEIDGLPKEVQERLVPIKLAPTDPRGPRTVRRRNSRKSKSDIFIKQRNVAQARAKSKRAKQARKKNRK